MRIKTTILILLALPSFVFLACSKDDNDSPEPANLTNKELLTAHTWQVGETYQNLEGTRTHYLRGGENTSGVNMGAMQLKFNSDGTGTHIDISGSTYNMTWSFTSADERNIRIVVNGSVTYDWLFTDINSEVIFSTSLVSTNGLITAKWIPVP